MAALNTSPGGSTFDVTLEDRASTQPAYGRQPTGTEANKAAVREELKRVNKLPVNSSYASHRLRVLNKILQLLAIQVVVSFMPEKYLRWPVSVSRSSRLGAGISNRGFLHGWTKVVSQLVRKCREDL